MARETKQTWIAAVQRRAPDYQRRPISGHPGALGVLDGHVLGAE
jgi:hypothetical protein